MRLDGLGASTRPEETRGQLLDFKRENDEYTSPCSGRVYFEALFKGNWLDGFSGCWCYTRVFRPCDPSLPHLYTRTQSSRTLSRRNLCRGSCYFLAGLSARCENARGWNEVWCLFIYHHEGKHGALVLSKVRPGADYYERVGLMELYDGHPIFKDVDGASLQLFLELEARELQII